MFVVMDGALAPSWPGIEHFEANAACLSNQRQLHGATPVEHGVPEQFADDQGHVLTDAGAAGCHAVLSDPGPSGAHALRVSRKNDRQRFHSLTRRSLCSDVSTI